MRAASFSYEREQASGVARHRLSVSFSFFLSFFRSHFTERFSPADARLRGLMRLKSGEMKVERGGRVRVTVDELRGD